MEGQWTLVNIEDVNVALDDMHLSIGTVPVAMSNVEKSENFVSVDVNLTNVVDEQITHVDDLSIDGLCLEDRIDGVNNKCYGDEQNNDGDVDYDIYGNEIKKTVTSSLSYKAALLIPKVPEDTDKGMMEASDTNGKRGPWKPMIYVEKNTKKKRLDRSYLDDPGAGCDTRYEDEDDDEWFYESVTLKQSIGRRRFTGLKNTSIKYQTRLALKA